MYGNDYGFSMISTDSGVTVAILTAADSDAYALGIHDGTVITGWDGTDIDEALRNVSCVTTDWPTPSFPTSENEDFMRPIFLAGCGGDTVNVRFIGDDGKETEVTLESNGSYYNRFMAAMKPVTGKRCDEFAYCEMLDSRCGYLCIPEEEYDTSGDIIAALTDDYPAVKELLISRIDQMRSQGMDRLIIDLRDNDGGLDVISAAVASLFTTEEIRTYSGFISGGKLVETKYWKWTVPADGRYSDIPVVVLVNAGTASAGDILTYNLSTCPNVTVMGITTSWGCAQGVAQTCLLSGGSIRLRYSIMATLDEDRNIYIDPGPDRISGITLDEKIPFDMDAVNKMYVQGLDYELEYALDWIERGER
jgi:C-terminal processing protease CtpA/Prc